MKTDICLATERGLTRLNEREPQYPPDNYFIKRNERYLRSYINDSRKIQRLVDKATPECKQRFKFFQIKPEDLEDLTGKKAPQRNLSPSDPFMSRRTKKYEMLHRSIMDTPQIIEYIKPHESTYVPSM